MDRLCYSNDNRVNNFLNITQHLSRMSYVNVYYSKLCFFFFTKLYFLNCTGKGRGMDNQIVPPQYFNTISLDYLSAWRGS
jgi:hypothetical protein